MFSQLLHSQVILCGSRDLDSPETAYIKENKILSLSVSELSAGKLTPTIQKRVSRNLYIHVDLDVLEPNDFPHLLIPTPGGIMFSDLADVLGQLGDDFTIVGSSIVEYVPVRNGDQERMEELVELLRPGGFCR